MLGIIVERVKTLRKNTDNTSLFRILVKEHIKSELATFTISDTLTLVVCEHNLPLNNNSNWNVSTEEEQTFIKK